jgi:hypothetical protein
MRSWRIQRLRRDTRRPEQGHGNGDEDAATTMTQMAKLHDVLPRE